MKRVRLWQVALLTAALTIAAAILIPTVSTIALSEYSGSFEEQILALHNGYRAQAGLEPLVAIEGLESAADIRAGECSVYFSHTRPDGSVWWSVNPDLVYGENLAMGYQDAESLVNAWMSSPAHYYNIMNPEYKSFGVSAVYAGGSWYFATEFGY